MCQGSLFKTRDCKTNGHDKNGQETKTRIKTILKVKNETIESDSFSVCYTCHIKQCHRCLLKLGWAVACSRLLGVGSSQLTAWSSGLAPPLTAARPTVVFSVSINATFQVK